MVRVKVPLVSSGKLELSEKEKGVWFAPPPLEARLGYAEVPFSIEIPVVEVVSVAVAEVASSNPVLFKLTVRAPLSPGSMNPSPLQHVSVFEIVDNSRNAFPTTGGPSDCKAA